MSLPPLAPVSALERRLGVPEASLEDLDLARAEEALDDASALIRAEAGTDWIDDDGVTITAPREVLVVCLQSVQRVFRNPEGLTSEAVDGYSASRGGDGVYLTAEEKVVVRRAATGRTRPFSGTVRTPSAYALPPGTDPAFVFWGLE